MSDYIVCLQCETPCYVFEMRDTKILEALCTVCGNDAPEEFMTAADYEELTSAPSRH